MRKNWILLPLAIALGGTNFTSHASTTTNSLPQFSSQPKYCLFFTVDGLDRDYITPEHTPNIYAWMKAGVTLPNAINVYPTLTTPNMTSIITGAFPYTTGIGSNQVFLKDEKKIVGAPRFNDAVTIAEAFKQGGHSTAAIQHFMLENRGADRYHHTGTKDSRDVTSAALQMLNEGTSIPTLMVVLYQTVDGMGHQYGQNTTGVLAEAKLVDREMGKILDHYRQMGVLKDTLVVVSSDHGMSSTEKDIDRKALNDAIIGGGWSYEILTKPGQKPRPEVDLYVMAYANLQCYFNRDFPLEEQERLFDAISKIDGIGRIFDSMALRRMGAHPNAGDFIVEPADGWWLGGGGGTHGRNRESDGHQSMMGAGIKAGSTVMSARTVDLVPTVLKAFNLPIPATVDGDVLTEALAR